ncbi:uncharacterized protein LOC117622478 isoform X2 [Prunus dulcis]|uniref:uncharacterized protein LOC117622478 isoform X2 n=1 Tax=Prunus dulcis TaxID=3755 RepID=UPI001482B0FF|nr:uncharacterized protein LOC117622478 isoform X2 [Prunus dulcis]
MGVLGVQNTSCWETRALSLEEEQILSCFPKEVKKEITSEVVSMSYIKQRELEEACRVKKPFCEWLVTRFQAAGRDRSSFLFWWQEIGSGINIKWVLNAVSIVNLQFSPCRKEKVAHSLTGIIQRYMNPPRVWYLDF